MKNLKESIKRIDEKYVTVRPMTEDEMKATYGGGSFVVKYGLPPILKYGLPPITPKYGVPPITPKYGVPPITEIM